VAWAAVADGLRRAGPRGVGGAEGALCNAFPHRTQVGAEAGFMLPHDAQRM